MAAAPSVSLATPEARGLVLEPVAAALLSRIEERATGTVIASRGQVKKEFFLRDGVLIAAESNLREEALGAQLVARGIIDAAELERLLHEVKATGRRMGAVLVDLRWLSPEGVLAELAEQVRRRVIGCLRWIDARVEFVPGEAKVRIVEHRIDGEKLIFRGLRETSTADGLAALLDESGAAIVRVAPRFERFRAVFEEIYGPALSAVLDGAPTVSALVLRPDAEMLARSLEGLLLTRLAALDGGAASPVADEPQDAFDDEPLTSPQFSLSRLLETAGQAEPRPAPARESEPGESGVLEFSTPPRTNPGYARMLPVEDGAGPAVETRGPDAELRETLLREYLELTGRTPYEVLGVPAAAAAPEVTAAYEAKTSRFSPLGAPGALANEDRPKLDAVLTAYGRALNVLTDPSLRRELDQHLDAAHAGPDPLGAELDFADGRRLLAAGELDQARRRFQSAVDRRPDQAAYHAYVGWTLFQLGGEPRERQARERVEHAIALDPGHGEAHTFLGRMAWARGDQAAARAHLERAIALEPEQPEAFEALLELLDGAGESRAAERLCRHALGGLGDRASALRHRLWRALGALYEGPLGDAASARLAYEAAARIDPEDAIARAKLSAFGGDTAGEPFPAAVRARTAAWAAAPTDRASAAALLELAMSAGRHDAAALVAAAAVLRGAADADIAELARQGRPRLLRRPAAPLTDEDLRLLGRDSAHVALEGIFAELSRTGVVEPFSAEALGVAGDPIIVLEALPPLFRKVLTHVSAALGVEAPSVVRRHDALGGDARVADIRPVCLLVGPALLDSHDAVELAFRLARALYLCPPGRCAPSARRGSELRPAFVGLLLASRAAAPPDTPEALAAEVPDTSAGSEGSEALARIVALEPSDRSALIARARSLAAGYTAVSLGAWSRALQAQATRVGLILCGDLLRVGRAVADEEGPDALEALLAFALAPEHFDLRERLDLAVGL